VPVVDQLPRRPQQQVVLRQLVDNAEPFLGEPVVASLVLDTNVAGIDSYELVQPASFPGWWVQSVEPAEPATFQVVEIDGVRFQRHLLSRHAIIPLKSGELVLPPVVARINIRGRNVFAAGQRVERRSEEVAVRVRERPYAPDGFTGAVGSFHYRASLEPRAIRLGESAVVTIELVGDGNLPLVEAPSVWPTCAGCELYPPEEESQISFDDSGIHGRRTWRASLVPRGSGKLRLEPVILAFFDPQAGTFRRQTVGAMSLDVGPSTPAGDSGEVAETPAVATPDPGNPGDEPVLPVWTWVALAAAIGVVGGVVGSRLFFSRRATAIPRWGSDQRPADRARELHGALERWRMESPRASEPEHAERAEDLRRRLEAVRFAPGRADHSQTIADLEAEVRRLTRR
jgi:hypothetical protein